ncbi:NUDIX hydrolase [Butyrivibrio hungatei]|uniref:NUDIX hydrolase n=1 Tax=Butyrivibrio hungatei TaxID=185008 RepID=UPI0004150DDA|nr:NUDIX hydrolase [Butyrivibrio hungatei]
MATTELVTTEWFLTFMTIVNLILRILLLAVIVMGVIKGIRYIKKIIKFIDKAEKYIDEKDTANFSKTERKLSIADYIKLYKECGYIMEMRKYVGHAPIMSCSCGVIIENAAGEILLQKRRDNGCWALIGGAMEMGETFEEAAKREVKEESGLSLGELEIFKICSGRDCIIEYPNGDVTFGPGIIFLTKEYEGEIEVDPKEVIEHRFFKKSEIPENLNGFDKAAILEWASRA